VMGLLVTVNLAGEPPMLDPKTVVVGSGMITIGGLPHDLESGAPAVGVLIPLPDGRTVAAVTTLRLLLTAADMLKAHYGDPRTP
jgi:hypothetical protein